jgi:hypothetical protein
MSTARNRFLHLSQSVPLAVTNEPTPMPRPCGVVPHVFSYIEIYIIEMPHKIALISQGGRG